MNNGIMIGGFALAAYLIGAIPNAYLIGKLKGVDIRHVGSGNVGATNVFRAVGKGWGVLTFVLDALKGFVPAFLFPLLANTVFALTAHAHYLAILCGAMAITGHNWPVYLRFKGGKGVATTTGALLGIAPPAVGIGFAVWVVVFAFSRYVSLASIVGALVVGAGSWFLYGKKEERILPITLTLLAILIIWRHRSNIQRLLTGQEHRFGKQKKPDNANAES